jgi:DNA modification methylase
MSERVEIGDAVLYHGDCLEILPTLGKVDAVVTDPPYGCAATTGRGGAYDGFELYGDKDTGVRDAMLRLLTCPAAVFGSPRIGPPQHRARLVWAKGEHTGMGDLAFPWKPDYEEIYILGDGWKGPRTSSVLKFNARIDSARFHATEKPVALMEEIVSKAPGRSVLDPFMGSGTTGVACANLGRKFIGVEIDERYFQIACGRVAAAYAQGRLFA